MTNWARVATGAVCASVGCVSVLAAQSASGLAVGDVFGTVGFAAGAGALIAWGGQREKVESHGQRLTTLEEDRVTRAEFETMGGSIRNIESDLRLMRETSESRMLQLLEMLERRRTIREE